MVVTATPDLWADSGHDWHRPVVLPTLPVVWPRRASTVGVMKKVPDSDTRERLAFAIRSAMVGRSAQAIADCMTPKRSKETVARWARGETVPSALDVAPLADALGVRVEFLVRPPELPSYPLSEYLVTDAAVEAAADERFAERAAQARPVARTHAAAIGSPAPRAPRKTAG